ncbi:hypothetical protein HDV06_001749 [Boothiomyces sp. JEL0866]|nr:hypothetical protein HDV06_001749 [Boothiomyces sp. JEL0866]
MAELLTQYFPTYKEAKTHVIGIHERPSWDKAVILGAQHLLAMFGGTVLSPFLMGFNTNTALFFSGIGTIIFFVITGGRVPSYLGSSFAFVGVVTISTGYKFVPGVINPNIGDALGGIIASGILYAIIAILVLIGGHHWIEYLLPPVVTGSIVMAIGLNLSIVAINDSSSDPNSAWQAAVTASIVALVSVFAKGFWGRLPILIGLILGFAIAILFDMAILKTNLIDWTTLRNTPVFAAPTFYKPTINWRAISTISPVVIIQVAENLGHVKAVGVITDTELVPYLGRAFLGDAIACILSAAGGGSGLTTYAENIGVMAVTNVYSTIVFLIAAVFAVILGFIPAFGALIATIPSGIYGGLTIILFGLVAATGARIWIQNKIDLGDSVNLITVAVAVVLGAGMANGTVISFGKYVQFDGLGSATIICILVHFVLRRIPELVESKFGKNKEAADLLEEGKEGPKIAH